MANDWVFTHDDDDNIEYWHNQETGEDAVVYRDGMIPLYLLSAKEITETELAGPPGSPGLVQTLPGEWHRLVTVDEMGCQVYKMGEYEAFHDPVGDFYVLHSTEGNGNIQIEDLEIVRTLLEQLHKAAIQRRMVQMLGLERSSNLPLNEGE